MTHMTPQATPLYAVTSGAGHVDLLLVVGWLPMNPDVVGQVGGYPVFVTLGATDGSPVKHYAAPLGAHVTDRITYHDSRGDARLAYAGAIENLQEPA